MAGRENDLAGPVSRFDGRARGEVADTKLCFGVGLKVTSISCLYFVDQSPRCLAFSSTQGRSRGESVYFPWNVLDIHWWRQTVLL